MNSNFNEKRLKAIEIMVSRNIEKKGLTLESVIDFSKKLETFGIVSDTNYILSPNLGTSNLRIFLKRLCKYKAFSIESAIPLEVLF
ncbi:MAG: hypothetical protein ACTSRK_01610, partial [Promethearchaeota archaeon]